MSLLPLLEQRASRDGELLARNRKHGDKLEVARPVDFEMAADSEKDASRVRDWIAARGYGETMVYQEDGEYRVVVRILMVTTPSILRCVSGLMATVASELGVRCGGWGCIFRI